MVYNRLMLKRLLYLLIVAVTFQFSWGVASAYCMHEAGTASKHFGHHEHQHKSAKAKADSEPASKFKKTSFHPDCASCSHHGSLGFAAWQPAPPSPSMRNDHDVDRARALSSPFLGLPERPQWAVA